LKFIHHQNFTFMKKWTLSLALTCFALFLTAQSLTLDSTFGVNGALKTYLNEPYGNPYGQNVVQLPNGEVATIGYGVDSIGFAAVEKFGNDGALDSSFSLKLRNLTSSNLALSAQADGKMLATGTRSAAPYPGMVFRLNPDGSLDPGFGTDGAASIEATCFDNILPMQLSNGQMVVFGDETPLPSDISIFACRLHSNGVIDANFGQNGYFRFALEDERVLVTAGVEQTDGKLLLAGMSSWVPFVVRINTNGSIDSTFGTGGYLIQPMPEGGETYAITLQPDGKIILCGYSDPGFQPTVARLLPNGSLDPSFGNGGVVYLTELPNYTEGIGIEVLPNGNLLAGISSFDYENFYLAQLLPSGERDSSFGLNGVYVYLNDDFRARAMNRSANMLAVSGFADSGNKVVLLRFILDLSVGTLNPNDLAALQLLVYPNPLSEHFNLKFELLEQAQVSIRAFDLQGKPVQTLVQDQTFAAGQHDLNLLWAKQLSAGNYILSLEVAGKKTKSIQIMKK
jgi:uncharacterized delta-60 repeat protein